MGSIFGGGKQKSTTTSNVDTTIRRIPAKPIRVTTGNSSIFLNPNADLSQPIDPNSPAGQFLPAGTQTNTVNGLTRDQFIAQNTIPSSNFIPDSARRFRTAFGVFPQGFHPINIGGITAAQAGTQFDNLLASQGRGVGGVVGNGIGVDVRLDPAIRSATNEVFGLANQGVGRSLDTIDSLRGNQNAFIQARVNPLIEQRDQRISQINQDLARRGVFGTFRNNEVNNFSTRANQQIADQRAQATQEAINAGFQAEAQARGYTQDIGNVASQLLQQELSALGLGQSEIQQMIASQLPKSSGGGNGTTTTTQSGGGDPLGSIGGLLGGIGSFF